MYVCVYELCNSVAASLTIFFVVSPNPVVRLTVLHRRSEYPDGFILVLVASAHENFCKTDR